MTKTIKISKELYERLASYAQGFDTPAMVIQRILDEKENGGKNVRTGAENNATSGKDYTKYMFGGKIHSKARLVYETIRKYALEHPKTTFKDLCEIFPAELQAHSLDVFMKWEAACKKYHGKIPRYYIKKNMKIDLVDCSIAVCNQWGATNIDNFIKKATELGYEIRAELSDLKKE